MTIKEMYIRDGFKHSSVSGELHGTCPLCGGDDRFIVLDKPRTNDSQCPDMGSFFCRRSECGFKGNAITYLVKVRRLSFLDACEYVGFNVEKKKYSRRDVHFKKKVENCCHDSGCSAGKNVWYPSNIEFESYVEHPESWMQHAGKFVEECHNTILQRESSLQWFKSRGVGLEMIKKMKIGFHQGVERKRDGTRYIDSFRYAKSWGMPNLPPRNDGTIPDKIVLPVGIVIPCFYNGNVVRIQIRRFDNSKHLVRGSIGWSKAHSILNPGNDIAFICENERDGMAVADVCKDITVLPLGTVTGRPSLDDHAELRWKKLILLSFDPDDGGIDGADWWFSHYKCAFPWFVTGYADIGDAIQSGYDIAEFVYRGIEYYLGGRNERVAEEKEVGQADDRENLLYTFCKMIHRYGICFNATDKAIDWGFLPEENLRDVDDFKVWDLMYEEDVSKYLAVLYGVRPGMWPGRSIWELFKGNFQKG